MSTNIWCCWKCKRLVTQSDLPLDGICRVYETSCEYDLDYRRWTVPRAVECGKYELYRTLPDKIEGKKFDFMTIDDIVNKKGAKDMIRFVIRRTEKGGKEPVYHADGMVSSDDYSVLLSEDNWGRIVEYVSFEGAKYDYDRLKKNHPELYGEKSLVEIVRIRKQTDIFEEESVVMGEDHLLLSIK